MPVLRKGVMGMSFYFLGVNCSSAYLQHGLWLLLFCVTLCFVYQNVILTAA